MAVLLCEVDLSLVTVTDAPVAVLWDLDGTIIDSEPYWIVAETELVGRFDGTWTHDDGLAMIGKGLPDTAHYLQERGVELSVDDITQGMTTRVLQQMEAAIPWRPGARELITSLFEADIPMAIATMAFTSMAESVAHALRPVTFGAIVAGDQVKNSKPHPEIYQTAAERLGVGINSCVAIEDSPVGIESAMSAGAVTIGVPLMLNLETSSAHLLWPSLAGKRVDDVINAFNEIRGRR